MWTAFSEIESAIKTLGLSDKQISMLPEEQGRKILATVKEAFLDGKNPMFWWEQYRDAEVWQPAAPGFELLEDLCPEAEVYLVPQGEDEEHVYISSPGTVSEVLRECAAFEYTVIGKALDWLVTETHHDTIVVVGEKAKVKLRSISG